MLSLRTLALNQGHRVNGAPHKLCCMLSFLQFSGSLASLTATITLPRLPFVTNIELHVPCTTLNVWIALVPPLRRAHVFCLHFFGRVNFSCLWPPSQEWVVFWNSVLCPIVRWFSESQAHFWLNYEVIVVVDPVELALFQDVDCRHLVHVVDVVNLLGAFLLSLWLSLGTDNSMEAA